MNYPWLDRIASPQDLRQLPAVALPQLADEIRAFLIEEISSREGHLGASLGAIELTMALHYLLETPSDVLVWDIGHQAYAHKILTGRKELFHTNRQLNGLSGFLSRSESLYDAFGAGHASTSISAALGMAMASKINHDHQRVHAAIIGDASIAGGMALEALNHAIETNAHLWVILNDNNIGIDPCIGALTRCFQSKAGATSALMREIFHFHYEGPVNGHSFDELIPSINKLKALPPGLKFLHVKTVKGKGFWKAEQQQVTYHFPGKFDKTTGELASAQPSGIPKYQDVFGKTLLELARQNDKIIGITPAMPTGSSLKYMMEAFPERAFDVGIAEPHAVTLSAGFAAEGFIPYCAIYSTFLQRAYDQVIHDVALQSLPVVFCIDRAGLVGHDGATHQGVFDLCFLRAIPNMVIYAPRDERALRNALYTAQLGISQPWAIRYPRGYGTTADWQTPMEPLAVGKADTLKQGSDIAIIAIGHTTLQALQVALEFPEKELITVIDIGFLKPLDEVLLDRIFRTHRYVITIEEGMLKGGLGSAIIEFANEKGYRRPIKTLGISDRFVPHGTVDQQRELCGLSPESLRHCLSDALRRLSEN